MTAVCIDPKRIDEVWPHFKHLIEAAHEYGDDTINETEKDVLSGNALLWLAWDGKKVLAAAVTRLWKSPRYKICSVTAVGGEQIERWADCLGSIEAYAKNEGCDVVRLSGRRGWKRVFKDYSEPWIVLEKSL